jgi:hypothetical protein
VTRLRCCPAVRTDAGRMRRRWRRASGAADAVGLVMAQLQPLGCLQIRPRPGWIGGQGLGAAEDRGFEPRRAVKPNRISSAAP